MNLLLFLVLNAVGYIQGASICSPEFELSIIHFNDFHSRFEPINKYAATCKGKEDKCIGGFSRLYATITRLKQQKPQSIVLNAGDNFQGSLWYTYYKSEAILHFLNKLPIDVHTIGNHEFDDKIKAVVPLLRNLKAPVVVSNIDDSEEPLFQGLYKKSVIIERLGRKIGVVGAIVTNTAVTARPEKLKFLNEIESINKEAKKLADKDKVDTIIVLSHCGYYTEMEIARQAHPKIGLIVGGHSHSLLYNGVPPDNLTAHGPYPTVVKRHDGKNVLVVQASAFSRVVAEINVRYDNNGNVKSWTGAPIYLDENVLGDPAIEKELAEWKIKVDEYSKTELGSSLIKLDGTNCYNFECDIGDFITDAMIYNYAVKGEKNYPKIAMINSGAIRSSIDVGKITIGDLLEILPYDNTLDVAEIKGKFIKQSLEHAAVISYGSRNLLQLSGLKVTYNMSKPEGSRVQTVKVICAECDAEIFKDLEMEKFYKVALITFLVQGGDGFSAISANLVNHSVGGVHREAIHKYISNKSPIKQIGGDRIKFVE